MNIFNIFFIREFLQILELIGKLDFPSRISFNNEENSIRLIIDINLDKQKNEINYKMNFYKNKKIINMNYLENSSFTFFLNQFESYVQNILPIKKNKGILTYKTLLEYTKNSFTVVRKMFKKNKLNRHILLLYLTNSIYVNSINGFNNNGISRTIIKSFNRINIISNDILYDQNSKNLLKLHNLNIRLFDYILQNNLKIFFLSLIVIITVVRISVSIVWIIGDIGVVFAQAPGLTFNLISLSSISFIFFNIIFAIIWLFVPSVILSILKFKLNRLKNTH